MTTLEKLKKEAKKFDTETKKMFKSCVFAAMNVDHNGLIDMWGDFKNRKDAESAINMWGLIPNKGISSRIVGKCYRITVDFK